jgi:hypothetical protein
MAILMPNDPLVAMVRYWKESPELLSLIETFTSQKHFDPRSKSLLIQELAYKWEDQPSIFEFICECASNAHFALGHGRIQNPRKVALKALLAQYPTHPKTIELLHDRALNDPDEQLRKWAQQQLEQWEQKKGSEGTT